MSCTPVYTARHIS